MAGATVPASIRSFWVLARMGEAKDWGIVLPIKVNLLGKMSRLEVQHILPKTRLYSRVIRTQAGERLWRASAF